MLAATVAASDGSERGSDGGRRVGSIGIWHAGAQLLGPSARRNRKASQGCSLRRVIPITRRRDVHVRRESLTARRGPSCTRRDLLVKAGVVGAGAVAAGSLAGAAKAAPEVRRSRRRRSAAAASSSFGMESDPVAVAPFGMAPGAAMWGKEHAYDSLAEFDRGLNIKPALATSWKADKKGTTFQLRKGVKFHNGKELTADDVVYSVKMMKNPPPPGSAAVAANVPGDDHRCDGRLEVRRADQPDGAGRPHHRLLRLAALRPDRPRGPLRPDQREPERDRHRPVQDDRLQPPRPRRARGQPELLEDRAAVHGRDHAEGDDRRAVAGGRPARRRHRRGDALRGHGTLAPRRQQPAGAEQPERRLPRASDDAQAGQERAVGRPARAPGRQLRDQPPADHRHGLQRPGGVHLVRPARLRRVAALAGRS